MNKTILDTPQVIVFHSGGGSSSQRTWDSSLPDTWDEAVYTWDAQPDAGTTNAVVLRAIQEKINAKTITR